MFVAVIILGGISLALPGDKSQSPKPLDVLLLVLSCAAIPIAILVKVRFGRLTLALIAVWWLGSMGWAVRELLRDHEL